MGCKLGIQLYSVRNTFRDDPDGTLERLAGLGYRYLEAANHNAAEDDGVGFGLPARELRQKLAASGLQIVGCHINPLRPDRLEAVLDYHLELGNKQIGNDTEFYPYGDMDYLRRRCELFNSVGELCRKNGMRFYYHNHYMEFQQFDGRPVYDIIMEHTDPQLVFAEMDTYWIARGGRDPVEYINRYRDRLILLHQKDFPAAAPQPLNMFDGILNADASISAEVFRATKNQRCFTEIGSGILPVQSYIHAAVQAPGLEYLLLEQDFTQHDELESVGLSMEGFRRFDGVLTT